MWNSTWTKLREALGTKEGITIGSTLEVVLGTREG